MRESRSYGSVRGVVGNRYPYRDRESDAVRLEGHWVDHPKYGRQFETEFMGKIWKWTRTAWRTSSPIILT